eukprot:8209949-Alexandrium_andersonii.AAC.1
MPHGMVLPWWFSRRLSAHAVCASHTQTMASKARPRARSRSDRMKEAPTPTPTHERSGGGVTIFNQSGSETSNITCLAERPKQSLNCPES